MDRNTAMVESRIVAMKGALLVRPWITATSSTDGAKTISF
jgi:hypothetical protein